MEWLCKAFLDIGVCEMGDFMFPIPLEASKQPKTANYYSWPGICYVGRIIGEEELENSHDEGPTVNLLVRDPLTNPHWITHC